MTKPRQDSTVSTDSNIYSRTDLILIHEQCRHTKDGGLGHHPEGRRPRKEVFPMSNWVRTLISVTVKEGWDSALRP